MKLKQSFPAPRSAWLDHIVSALMQGIQAILAEKIVDAIVMALATTFHRLQHATACVVTERNICNARQLQTRVEWLSDRTGVRGCPRSGSVPRLEYERQGPIVGTMAMIPASTSFVTSLHVLLHRTTVTSKPDIYI